MKALIVTTPGKVEINEIPTPVPKEKEVLVRVAYAGICGTDLEIASGNISFAKTGELHYPVRIGHEWSGIVEETGSGVSMFKAGDRVFSDTWVHCGICATCVKGDYDHCEAKRSIGTIGNAYPGAFAEYMLLHEYHLHILPDSISLEEGAVIEPVTIANHALHRSRLYREPDFAKNCIALVTGCGGIGIAAVKLLRCAGVKTVIAAGRGKHRLDVAAASGAETIDLTKENMKKRTDELTAEHGCDLVIDTSGYSPLVHSALDCTAAWGEIMLLAFYQQPLDGIDLDRIVNNCISIIGVGGQAGVNEVVSLAAEGKLKLGDIISHVIDIYDAPEYIMDPSKFGKERIKAIVRL